MVKQPLTHGYRIEVAVNYGDPSAYNRLQEAFRKIGAHREAAERYRSDQQVYYTQGECLYDLALDDVQYYHLDGRGPEEAQEEEYFLE